MDYAHAVWSRTYVELMSCKMFTVKKKIHTYLFYYNEWQKSRYVVIDSKCSGYCLKYKSNITDETRFLERRLNIIYINITAFSLCSIKTLKTVFQISCLYSKLYLIRLPLILRYFSSSITHLIFRIFSLELSIDTKGQ